MKFTHKVIHGGPVHPCYERVEALQHCKAVYGSVWMHAGQIIDPS